MQAFLNWLQRHRFINTVLIVAYFLAQVFGHIHVAHLSVKIMLFFSLPLYNKIIAELSWLVAVIYTVLILRYLNSNRQHIRAKCFYLAVTIALIAFHASF